MRSVALDGATLMECGLCGEQFGDRRAVMDQALADEATERGIDKIIWPLARLLGQLPGLSLAGAAAGTSMRPPSVELVVTGQDALLQIENVAKALRLAAGSLRCQWNIVARFEHSLVFCVAPVATSGSLRDARGDIGVLAQHIERDMRLRWWRCASVAPNG